MPEIFKVTCNAGSTLNGGEHFTFQTPDKTNWYCYIIVDYNYSKIPIIPVGYKSAWIYVNKTDSADVVASKLQLIFNPLVFRVPRRSGLVGRTTDGHKPYTPHGNIATSADFPDLNTVQFGWYYTFANGVIDNDITKTNTGITFDSSWGNWIFWDGAIWQYLYDPGDRLARPDGTSGRYVGTVQHDDFRSHAHLYDHIDPSLGTFSFTAGGAGDKFQLTSATTSSGGNESRSKNIAVFYLIKY